MSNTSTNTVACVLCVGAAPELYLEAMLASIAGAIDVLVVNDNSGLAHSANVATLEASAFAARGALQIHRNPFVDFADMRNRGFAPLLTLEPSPDWVMFIDADEVHGSGLRYIAREILPGLGPETGSLDGYTYHFFGTFGWITDIARRLAFYRFARNIAWSNPVHEKIAGLTGRALVLPYVYHHYGNVLPPSALVEKHRRYFELGNEVRGATEDSPAWYLEKAADVRPFRGRHPSAAGPTIAALEAAHAAAFAAIDAGFRARRTPLMRGRSMLRGAAEALRVGLRRAEHPGLFPGAGARD
jgi:hypothetical protein